MASSVPAVRQVSSPQAKRSLMGRLAGAVAEFLRSPVGVTDLSAFVSGAGGWFSVVKEPFTGAWQRNMERSHDTVATHYAVYSTVSLIASDISKMCAELVEKDMHGIWKQASSNAFSPVLRKPNDYQNRIKFIEQWVLSKLLHGNAYILKERDARGVVVKMYVLHPHRVRPMVTPNGDVYYNCSGDNLAGLTQSMVIPSSEIIHDVHSPLFHPLCGVSPLIACGMAAIQGLAIQSEATRFFENGSLPGGILSSPENMTEIEAREFKKKWEENYGGANRGRVAILAGGLKFEKLSMTNVESQLIEQLKWTAETICSCFHVPAYMVGIGEAPAYGAANVEALNQQYYTQCLQALIEQIEECLLWGLGLPFVKDHDYAVRFNLDGLLRMDTATAYKTYGDGVKSALLSPNEGRLKLNLPPVAGGESPYLQQQNFSLAALAKRDAQDDPFKSAQVSSSSSAANPPAAANDDEYAATAQLATWAAKDIIDRLPPLAA